jgi:hypothetical protein
LFNTSGFGEIESCFPEMHENMTDKKKGRRIVLMDLNRNFFMRVPGYSAGGNLHNPP